MANPATQRREKWQRIRWSSDLTYHNEIEKIDLQSKTLDMRETWEVGMEGLGGWVGIEMGWDGVGVQATLLFPIISLSRQDASLSLSFPAILHFLDSPTQYTDYKKGASMKILFCRYDINLRIEQCLIFRVPISNISNIDSGNF